MKKIAILGGGAFGLALANVLIDNNKLCVWWREEDSFEDVNSALRKKLFMPDVDFNPDICLSTDIEAVIDGASIVIIAVPSGAIRDVISKIKGIDSNAIIVSTSKGIECETLMTYTAVIKEILPNNPVCYLTGPSHAEELGLFKLTALMVGGTDEGAVNVCMDVFKSPKLILKSSNDPVGMEICAAFKNLVALAMGISDGMECGDNTKAIIFTIGLEEMRELCNTIAGKSGLVYSYAGVGDLYVTTSSIHSRNKKAGFYIAEGNNFKEASELVGQLVEGINNFESVKGLFNKHGIDSKIVKILDSANNKNLDKHELHKILKGE